MNALLGELLISANKITEEQLLEVLESQITEGGRLGTNLIERGYISEEELTHFLSEQFHLPIVPQSELAHIDPGVLQLIPRELGITYEMLPFSCEGKALKVVVVNPILNSEIAELDALKNFQVHFHVASELRIQSFLKKYYQSDTLPDTLPDGPADRPQNISPETRPRFTQLLSEERNKIENAFPQSQNGSLRDADPGRLHLELAKKDFLMIQNRDEAIQVLMRTLSFFLERVYCFSMKKGTLKLWMSLPEGDANKLKALNPTELPLFEEVIRSKTHYAGPMMTSGMEKFIEALDIRFPPQVVVFPLCIKGHCVCIFYGDNFLSKKPIAQIETLKKLIDKCGLALEILILRNKIIDA